MKKILICMFIVCLLGINVFAENNLESKLKEFKKQNKQVQKSMLDGSLRDNIYEFLLTNKEISLRDFKKVRLSAYASKIMYEELSRKYDANPENYHQMIKNKKDQEIYKISMDVQKKYNLREFYLCKGDEVKAVESFQKVWELRKKGPKDKNSEEWLKIDEQILEECKFDMNAIKSLLAYYRYKGYREKYNEMMLRIVKDDQVNYDYLYYPVDELNASFITEYLLFFTNVNSLKDKLILSREQVKFIAEDMLAKHQEMFNFQNRYYSPEDGSINEYRRRDAVQALVNVSTWLREYKLKDLNDNLINRFFTIEEILKVVKYDDQFKDFRDYLK